MSAAIKCDGCGRFEELPQGDYLRRWEPLPKHWMQLNIGIEGGMGREELAVSVCSPACASAKLEEIDKHWASH